MAQILMTMIMVMMVMIMRMRTMTTTTTIYSVTQCIHSKLSLLNRSDVSGTTSLTP